MPRPTREQLRPPRKKIRVRAGDGLMVQFPRATLAAPGGRGRAIYGDEVVEVHADDRFVLRSLRNGDLVKVAGEPAAKSKRKASSKATGTVSAADFAGDKETDR